MQLNLGSADGHTERSAGLPAGPSTGHFVNCNCSFILPDVRQAAAAAAETCGRVALSPRRVLDRSLTACRRAAINGRRRRRLVFRGFNSSRSLVRHVTARTPTESCNCTGTRLTTPWSNEDCRRRGKRV